MWVDRHLRVGLRLKSCSDCKMMSCRKGKERLDGGKKLDEPFQRRSATRANVSLQLKITTETISVSAATGGACTILTKSCQQKCMGIKPTTSLVQWVSPIISRNQVQVCEHKMRRNAEWRRQWWMSAAVNPCKEKRRLGFIQCLYSF